MSNFLNNILSRHSAQLVDGVSPHMVEPRLKTRFEADPGTDPSSLAEGETGHVPSAVARPFLQNHDTRPTVQHDDPTENTVRDHSVAKPGDRIASLINRPGNGRPESGVPSDEIQIGREPGTEAQSVTMQPPDAVTRQPLYAADLKNHRQAPLQDLNDKSGLYHDHQLSDTAKNPGTSRDVVISPPTAAEGPLLAVEPEMGALNVDLSDSNYNDTHPLTLESLQPGETHIPQWVAEIRSSLQERLGASAAQKQPEPVINVSIGRVEIRATGEEAARLSDNGKKPRSIMSLEDYLEKRDGRQL